MRRHQLPTSGARGFTLVELLVVLVMLSILITLAAPSFSKLHATSSLRAAARTTYATFQYARSLAVARQTEVRLVFSDDRRVFHVETLRPIADGSLAGDSSQMDFVPERTALGRSRKVPAGIDVSVTRGVSAEEEHVLAFHPNGSTDDAILTLTNRSGRKLYVTLQGVTGHAAIEADLDKVSRKFLTDQRS